MSTKSQSEVNVDGMEAYVCPHCRILFSLPPLLGGNGAMCPGCGKLLTIPEINDGVNPIGLGKGKYNQAGVISKEISEIEVQQYMEQWAEDKKIVISDVEEGEISWRWMLPLGLMFLVLLGGVGYIMMSNDSADSTGGVEVVDTTDVGGVSDSGGNLLNTGKKNAEYDKYNKQDVERLESYLTKLVAVKTVDELLLLVRPVDGLREKMLKFYDGEMVAMKKFKKLEFSNNSRINKGYVLARFILTDFSIEEAALKYDKGSFTLDWESYVGYSEFTWDELKNKRPTTPFMLRVIVSSSNYYNRDFSDEKTWKVLSMVNPNEKGSLYGYVLNNSATMAKLSHFGFNTGRNAVTIRAHYPADAKTDDQMIVDEVISESWIVE